MLKMAKVHGKKIYTGEYLVSKLIQTIQLAFEGFPINFKNFKKNLKLQMNEVYSDFLWDEKMIWTNVSKINFPNFQFQIGVPIIFNQLLRNILLLNINFYLWYSYFSENESSALISQHFWYLYRFLRMSTYWRIH